MLAKDANSKGAIIMICAHLSANATPDHGSPTAQFMQAHPAAPLPPHAHGPTPLTLATQRPPPGWRAAERPLLAARSGAPPHAPPLVPQPHQGLLAAGGSCCCRCRRRRRHCTPLPRAAPAPPLAGAAAVAPPEQAQKRCRAACTCAGAGAGGKGQKLATRLDGCRCNERSRAIGRRKLGDAHPGLFRDRGPQQAHSSLLDATCTLASCPYISVDLPHAITGDFWHARR